MKLITKEIEKLAKQYPLYGQEDKGDEAMVWCRFFDPTGSGTWYVTEMNIEKCHSVGNKQFISGTMFCYVTGLQFDEWGYTDLEELFAYRGMFNLGIERDLGFTPCTVGELKASTWKG